MSSSDSSPGQASDPAVRAARAYREEAVLTAAPERLVLMMLDRASGELEQLIQELEANDPADAASIGTRTCKVHDLVSELRGALDPEQGGELAERLDALYEFVLHQLGTVNTERQPAPAQAALQVITELREAWDGVQSAC